MYPEHHNALLLYY